AYRYFPRTSQIAPAGSPRSRNHRPSERPRDWLLPTPIPSATENSDEPDRAASCAEPSSPLDSVHVDTALGPVIPDSHNTGPPPPIPPAAPASDRIPPSRTNPHRSRHRPVWRQIAA